MMPPLRSRHPYDLLPPFGRPNIRLNLVLDAENKYR